MKTEAEAKEDEGNPPKNSAYEAEATDPDIVILPDEIMLPVTTRLPVT